MTTTLLLITWEDGNKDAFEFATKQDALNAVNYINKNWDEKIATYSVR